MICLKYDEMTVTPWHRILGRYSGFLTQFDHFPGEQSWMMPEYDSLRSAGKMAGVIRLLNTPGRFIIRKLEDFFER